MLNDFNPYRSLFYFVIPLLFTANLFACPFCGEAAPSYSEQIAAFDVVALGKFTGGEQADRSREFAGITQYEIVEIVKDESGLLEKGDRIEVDRYRHSEDGALVLLLANRDDKKVKWNLFIDMTPESFEYLSNAPNHSLPTTERLAYFLKFLENEDQNIASDAFSEFAIAPYQDIVPLAPLMDRKKVRDWIANPEEPPSRFVRLGLYGLMIGLCGKSEDAEFLKSIILENPEDYKFGVNGMISGYLMLAGTKGFQQLENDLFSDPDAPLPKIFPALQALRFMSTYGTDENLKPNIKRALRSMVDQKLVSDMVILDLARMKDWESMDKIASMYGKEPYDVSAIKRSIVRFLLAAESSSSQDAGQKTIQKAQTYLQKIKQKDPKTYRDARRYYFQ